MHGQSGITHGIGDSSDGLTDLGLGFSGGVGGLQGLLLGPEGFDLGLERVHGGDELLLLLIDAGVLGLQVGELRGNRGATGEGLAGQILVVLRERCFGLVLEFGGLRLELIGLELDPLLGGGDIGDGLAHLGELLELLLVGEVEGLARVFHSIERLVGLGLEDGLHALPGTCHCCLLGRGSSVGLDWYASGHSEISATAHR